MEMLELTIDGQCIMAEKNTRLDSIISAASDTEYSHNPVVAAKVNGLLTSLSETIAGNAVIETVNLVSPLGKRVYRKSLCFLLSYASAAIAPERTLIIGHSLGDGYYFRYRDHLQTVIRSVGIRDDNRLIGRIRTKSRFQD